MKRVGEAIIIYVSAICFITAGRALYGNSVEAACLDKIDARFVFYGGDEVSVRASGTINNDKNEPILSLREFSIAIGNKLIDQKGFDAVLKKAPGIKLETLLFGREPADDVPNSKVYIYHLTFDYMAPSYAGGRALPGEYRRRMLIIFDQNGIKKVVSMDYEDGDATREVIQP